MIFKEKVDGCSGFQTRRLCPDQELMQTWESPARGLTSGCVLPWIAARLCNSRFSDCASCDRLNSTNSLWFYTLTLKNNHIYLLFICVCVHACLHVCVGVSVVSVSLCVSMYGCMCVGVRGQAASLPTMWILRTVLRLSGLVASTMTHWATSLSPLTLSILRTDNRSAPKWPYECHCINW